jgi:CMP-2-keto-3-deoxyoctulosonic acid synthetase
LMREIKDEDEINNPIMWKSLIKTDFALYFPVQWYPSQERKMLEFAICNTLGSMFSQTGLVWLLQLTHEVIGSIRKLEQLRYLNLKNQNDWNHPCRNRNRYARRSGKG